MKTIYKALALVSVSTVLCTAGFVTAQMPSNAKPDDSVCQITLPNGNVQDLSNMCGQTNSASNEMPPIDLNAPSPVVLVGSPTPSKLWDTLPNLKEAPKAGKTEPMKPSAGSSAAPIEATDPKL